MTGEFLAILAALAYGLAGVSIMQGNALARGDNGVFLSVVLTALLSCGLWINWGVAPLSLLLTTEGLWACGIFALAGLLSNFLGRRWMYRATEQIGAVRTGLLRRFTPVFALPCAFLILGELPGPTTLLGGAFILAGVLAYLFTPSSGAMSISAAGFALGMLSALAYALAYSFRSLGIEAVPDAAFGTFVGASIAAIWILMSELIYRGPRNGWYHITIDRSLRHWRTALALSIGQLLQFFALKWTSVVSVAVLGTLEVLFAAMFILLFSRNEAIAITRLLIASLLSMAGTALLLQTQF